MRLAAVCSGDAPTGAITLLVTHRFATVGMADLIVVLDRGQIVEQGSHGGTGRERFDHEAKTRSPNRHDRLGPEPRAARPAWASLLPSVDFTT